MFRGLVRGSRNPCGCTPLGAKTLLHFHFQHIYIVKSPLNTMKEGIVMGDSFMSNYLRRKDRRELEKFEEDEFFEEEE